MVGASRRLLVVLALVLTLALITGGLAIAIFVSVEAALAAFVFVELALEGLHWLGGHKGVPAAKATITRARRNAVVGFSLILYWVASVMCHYDAGFSWTAVALLILGLSLAELPTWRVLNRRTYSV